jgi:prepilin-type processing-associated H-X9-DG protein
MISGSSSRTGPVVRAAALAGLLATAVATVGLVPSERSASAQAPAALPPELQLVPADAAYFLHADAAQLWDGPIGKSVRAADPKTIDQLVAQAKELFGITPDQLRTVTFFIPRLKEPRDAETAVFVVTSSKSFDKDKLKAGFEKLLKAPGTPDVTLRVLSDTSAALLFGGVKDEQLKPRPATETGPLSAALKEAATGKHALVAGSALANLPDQIRADDVPGFLRSFQPLFKAESIAAVVDLGKELTAEVRVKAGTPAQAIECEKALGLLVSLGQEGLAEGIKELSADKEPMLKDVVTLIKALQDGLKGAKFTTDKSETRVSLKVPADLPFGTAFLGAKVKVQGAAARTRSANNLKQIGLALHNYHDVNGAFPPAAVCDKTGKPMLSWRVLILPYIEQDVLYKEFKLDEPWDSEHNKKLLAKMPKVYEVPDQTAPATETHYRVFAGNGAVFDYVRGSKILDITDGTSNTIMVATAAAAVPWTKPDELNFDPDKDMVKLLGTLPSGDVCNVAFCDGSVRAMNVKKLTRKTLNALVTKAGGEIIEDIP